MVGIEPVTGKNYHSFSYITFFKNFTVIKMSTEVCIKSPINMRCQTPGDVTVVTLQALSYDVHERPSTSR